MTDSVRVLVSNEHRHERTDSTVAGIYPDGIHGAVAGALGGQWLSAEKCM